MCVAPLAFARCVTHEQHARSYRRWPSARHTCRRKRSATSSRIVTRSARPLASITESLRKPRPAAGNSASRLAGSDAIGTPSTSQVSGSAPALGLDHHAGAVAVLDLDLGAIGREGDLHGGLEEAPGAVLVACASRKRFSGGGRSVPATRSAPAGAGGSGARRGRQPGEGIEQHRRGGGAAGKPRRCGAIGPADPHGNGVAAVVADRPGVAEAVGRAGLVGDLARLGVGRRRRVAQDVGDVPGGDRRQQPLRGRGRLGARRASRRCLSATGSPPRARPA